MAVNRKRSKGCFTWLSAEQYRGICKEMRQEQLAISAGTLGRCTRRAAICASLSLRLSPP